MIIIPLPPDMILRWIEKPACKERQTHHAGLQCGQNTGLLYSLNQLGWRNRLPDLDYYVDSPLSVEATEIVRHPEYFNKTIQKVMQSDNDPFFHSKD